MSREDAPDAERNQIMGHKGPQAPGDEAINVETIQSLLSSEVTNWENDFREVLKLIPAFSLTFQSADMSEIAKVLGNPKMKNLASMSLSSSLANNRSLWNPPKESEDEDGSRISQIDVNMAALARIQAFTNEMIAEITNAEIQKGPCRTEKARVWGIEKEQIAQEESEQIKEASQEETILLLLPIL